MVSSGLVGRRLKAAFLDKIGKGRFRTSGPPEYRSVLSSKSEYVFHAPKRGAVLPVQHPGLLLSCDPFLSISPSCWGVGGLLF